MIYDNIPNYYGVLNDNYDAFTGLALVSEPAIESNFIAFSKVDTENLPKQQEIFKVEDETEHCLLGVLMRSDFPIFRLNSYGEPYNLIFRAEDIRKFAQRMMKHGTFNNVNKEHDWAQDIWGKIELQEMFIKDSKRGISPKGFEDISEGSLFARYKVLDIDLWKEIQDGKYLGFSLETYCTVVPEALVDEQNTNTEEFSKEPVQTEEKPKTKKIMKNLKELLRSVFAQFGNTGNLYYDGDTLEVGTEVTDANGEPIADGEFEIEGKVYIVKDGKVSEIKDAETEEPEETPADPEPKAEEEQAEEETPATEEPADPEDTNSTLEGRVKQLEDLVAALTDRVKALEDAPATQPIETEFSVVKEAKGFDKKSQRAIDNARAYREFLTK